MSTMVSNVFSVIGIRPCMLFSVPVFQVSHCGECSDILRILLLLTPFFAESRSSHSIGKLHVPGAVDRAEHPRDSLTKILSYSLSVFPDLQNTRFYLQFV